SSCYLCLAANLAFVSAVTVHARDFIFFFQAEDGIRDPLVTGVQTCALPICWTWDSSPQSGASYRSFRKSGRPCASPQRWKATWRSEERRVGKEWRSGRSG